MYVHSGPPVWPAIVEAIAVVVATGIALIALLKQASDEKRRNTEEEERAQARRAAVDARISSVAYAVRRQLRSWVDGVSDDVRTVIAVTDGWLGTVQELGGMQPGEVPGLTPGLRDVAGDWAYDQTRHFDSAEARMLGADGRGS